MWYFKVIDTLAAFVHLSALHVFQYLKLIAHRQDVLFIVANLNAIFIFLFFLFFFLSNSSLKSKKSNIPSLFLPLSEQHLAGNIWQFLSLASKQKIYTENCVNLQENLIACPYEVIFKCFILAPILLYHFISDLQNEKFWLVGRKF